MCTSRVSHSESLSEMEGDKKISCCAAAVQLVAVHCPWFAESMAAQLKGQNYCCFPEGSFKKKKKRKTNLHHLVTVINQFYGYILTVH